jgi:hypothetical protein
MIIDSDTFDTLPRDHPITAELLILKSIFNASTKSFTFKESMNSR